MPEKCEICKKVKDDVRFYSADDLDIVELIEEGNYCSDCIEKIREEWWELETSAYCDGNCDDCEYLDENGECERDII